MANYSITLTDSLYEYLLKVSLREAAILKELRDITAKMDSSAMQIAPEQGQFMALLVQLIGAKRALEIGVYTGYSSLCVAQALPVDGQLIACDVNEEWTGIAQTFWRKANVANKIDLRLAPALQTLDQLLAENVAPFDFVFIDADKANYSQYYEKSLRLLRPGGLLAVDNTLWGGDVANPSVQDNSTRAIRALNEELFHDERVDISLVPIGDGMTLARKR